MPTYKLLQGDCLEVLKTLPDNSIDAVVTDPPYGLEFMGKEWDAPWKTGGWQSGGGFSKPGIGDRKTAWPSFSAASKFGAANPTCGTCGGRARGKKRCECVEPRWKPIGKRRNPENEGLPDDVTGSGTSNHLRVFQGWCELWAAECLRVLKPGGHLLAFGGTRTYHRLACAIEDAGFEVRDSLHWIYGSGFPKSLNLTGEHKGRGTALKPAHEPVVVARKPLIGTVAVNIQQYGCGALNIDGCRVHSGPSAGGSISGASALGQASGWNAHNNRTTSIDRSMAAGRWPSNLILSHTPECGEACAEDCAVAELDRQTAGAEASRFFPVFRYQAKASKSDRGAGNIHPTVKPVALMEWLCTLVTPPNGTVLDPFTGSGTTGIAALNKGFHFIGIEREPSYIQIAEARIESVHPTPPPPPAPIEEPAPSEQLDLLSFIQDKSKPR